MAIQTINLGTYANDGTGDDLRTAFEKVNANLVELYSISGGANIGSVPPISGVAEGELWWSTVEGRLYVYYGTAWIDASPVDGFVEYDISAVATTGGANIRLSGTDLSQDNIKIASSTNITVTQTDVNTITLSSTSYTGNVTGNLTGNADTVTNGVYTNESYANPTWITSLAGSKISGDISGNAGSVTNGVYTTGDQTIGGTKTFSNTISGSITGNAGSVTNGVYTTDVGTVTNTMLAGFIPNDKLANNSLTINGTTTGLGGSVTISTITGNAGTVTNGVYTSESYADPSWITSLAGSKVSGNIAGNAGSVTNGVYTNGSYADPIWITSLAGSKVSGNISGNAGSVTNGVYTNGSYADPTWITSIAGSKVSGDISGNASTVTNGVYTTSSINSLVDVNTVTSTPTIGQALVWNGTNWVPGSVAGINNFNFGGFNKVFTDPISYLLDKTGIDMGTFALPAEESVDLGTF